MRNFIDFIWNMPLWFFGLILTGMFGLPSLFIWKIYRDVSKSSAEMEKEFEEMKNRVRRQARKR